jgi:HK97 family phage prohead protease
MKIEQKTVRMELKALEQTGEFVGMSSVFGNVDLGGDIVEKGAFSKSISERGGKFPLLYGHKINVGVSYVAEKDFALETRGFINLESASGREVFSNMQFYKKHGMDFGMSIGYAQVPGKTEFRGDTRILREVKLFENTLTEFPMNELARVTSLKDISALVEELKSGRRFSAATRAEITSTIDQLQALLNEAAPVSESEKAAKTPAEPVEDHSQVISIIENIRSMIPQ